VDVLGNKNYRDMMIFGFFFTLVYSVCRGVFMLIVTILKAFGKVLMFLTGVGHQKADSHRG
jgi:hypothetical protein